MANQLSSHRKKSGNSTLIGCPYFSCSSGHQPSKFENISYVYCEEDPILVTLISNLDLINNQGFLSKFINLCKLNISRQLVESIFVKHDVTLRNLKNQVDQLPNELRNRPQGASPSNTEKPRSSGKEHGKVVALRSGRSLEPKVVEVEDKPVVVQNKEEVQLGVETPTLKKPNSNTQFKRILNVLKQMHISIPFVEALEQIPNLVKVTKEFLSKKRRLGEFEILALTTKCGLFL
ncbi:Aspartic peptidase [Gossypium australe]|uniref:Aspartic peptidase n=1 Tax=Gossypium australe TaxID=47621 RepID=A0A5B6VCK2_9ROSI|nr:Aspartic peptidase [Gossypium australe]